MTLPVYPNAISLGAISSEFGVAGQRSLGQFRAGQGIVPDGTGGLPLGVETLIPSSGAVKFGNFHASPAFFTHTEQAKLVADDPATNNAFGVSVALSADGNTALIGANGGDAPFIPDSGAAYVFIRSGGSWITPPAKLYATDAATDDQFGFSVALSADGTTALIGAPYEDTSPNTNNGAAYVWIKTGGAWITQEKLTAQEVTITTNDQFGVSVALSADGNTALIGADQYDQFGMPASGAAYVFTRSGGSWTKQARLLPSDAATQDLFGTSVALSADGNTALIGALLEDTAPNTNNGAAYVFTRSGGSWSQQQKLTASDAKTDDYFGSSVALSDDGNTAVIGAYAEGDGPLIDNGAAYVFTRSGGSWSQQQKLTALDLDSGDYFGSSVALSADGNTVVIGAYNKSTGILTNNGAAYVFTRSGGVWTQKAKLTNSDAATPDNFGKSVAISSNSNTLLIGAYSESTAPNSGNGAAYVFNR